MKIGNPSGIALLSVIFATLACSQPYLPLSDTSPSGTIVYQSNQDGNSELYAMDIRQKVPLRLTNNSSNDISPTHISTNDLIGFASDRTGEWNLYTSDLTGNDVTQITDETDMAVDYPNWSADGNYIAASLVEHCTADSKSCTYDIYTMRADGTNRKNLTNTPESEWVPDWSPDTTKIAFASDRDGDSDVYIIDADGSNLTQVTKNEGYDGNPRWSPDGTRIVFDSDREGGDWDIFIMNADGSDPLPITHNTTVDFSASWSPDGQWLVYLSNAFGNNEILIIDLHGQNQQRLTNNTANEVAPTWLP